MYNVATSNLKSVSLVILAVHLIVENLFRLSVWASFPVGKDRLTFGVGDVGEISRGRFRTEKITGKQPG